MELKYLQCLLSWIVFTFESFTALRHSCHFVWSQCPETLINITLLLFQSMFQVWHSFVLWRRFLLSHSSDSDLSFIVLLCSGPLSDRLWLPFSLQSAHISNSITSCSLLLWLAIILQLNSCRELEAKWMLWRMLMCVEWEHCLPVASRARASDRTFVSKRFSCFSSLWR